MSELFDHRPRLPGPSAPRAKGRRAFGETWWGAAWVDALEQRARLDANRLPRGRTYARSGAVGDLALAPGEILASVQGSRRTPYKVRVRVRAFEPREWERLLDALAAEIGHTAALLDGELPPGVADDVRGAGLDLLPGPGELQPRCSCPDWADPCKHSAAVCYLVADALDADPFDLLLRGRGRDEVLAALRARRHAGEAPPPAAGEGPERDRGVPARDAWRREPGPVPAAPHVPRHARRPTVLAADPPAGSGIDADALRSLAADAAARALALLHGATASGLELDAAQDLARRAAAALPTGDATTEPRALVELAARAGMPARELLRRGLAYRDGGAEALALLEGSWDPGPDAVAPGKALLGERAVARRNRVTLGERQLRLGRDGRWYPYRKERGGGWRPDGAPLAAAAEDEVGELETGVEGRSR